jgi:tetratricopeptide (TPR) repeat protein
VNGYWHGANNNWWNNWGGFATGVAVGGLAGWGMGSSWWNWGYTPYVNPYVIQQPIVVQQPVVVDQTVPTASLASYDYSQPIDTTAAPPDDATADPALSQFDNARALFKQGDLAGALAATDAALKVMPNDAAMHEFRALCLFALGRYPEAAGVLYAVLSVGPGWDWTTLIGLYPSIDVYTTQLRALEDFARANPDDAASRFVLGYHYLTQGHPDNALKMFQKVVQLQPKDTLSAAIVQQLGGAAAAAPAPADPNAPAAAQPQPAAAPAGPAPKLEDVKGAPWSASPADGVTVQLALGAGDSFTWTVTQKGQAKPISGTYTYADGLLTLAQANGPALVGRLTAEGAGFRFQATAAGGNDPGLLFAR